MFPRLLLCLVLATASFRSHAAEPFLEKTDLFKGGEDGFALYRIPGIVTTAKGTVLAYCEARLDGKSDWGEIEVHLRRSTDGGKTWDLRGAGGDYCGL
jgi:sialidase-1